MPQGIAITSVILRVLTNAGLFALLGAQFNAITAIVLATVGAALGGVHAYALVKCKAYPNDGRGWFLLIIDHTWSLINTAVGSVFLVANLIGGNRLDTVTLTGRTTVVLTGGVAQGFATTIGPVEAGTNGHIARHEYIHVLQSRIFGPFYIPLVLVNYVLATILPYWLIYHDHAGRPIRSFGDYFMRGVYPHVWNEEWAYAVEGSPP